MNKIAAEAAKEIAERYDATIMTYGRLNPYELQNEISSIVESALSQSLAEREQRINRLRELATDWIRDETHKRNCDHWYAVPGCVPSCSCGLSSLRAALATEGEKP